MRVTTALVPFLAEMERVGEQADAQAAEAVEKMAAEVVERTEAQRRAKEKKAVEKKVEDVKKDLSIKALEKGVTRRRSSSDTASFRQSERVSQQSERVSQSSSPGKSSSGASGWGLKLKPIPTASATAKEPPVTEPSRRHTVAVASSAPATKPEPKPAWLSEASKLPPLAVMESPRSAESAVMESQTSAESVMDSPRSAESASAPEVSPATPVAVGDPALEEQAASLLADKEGLIRMLEEFNSCMQSNSKLKREVKQLRAEVAASAAPSWECKGCGQDNFPKFCSRCGTPCGAYKPDLPSTRYKNLTDAGEIMTGAISEEDEEDESPGPLPGAVDDTRLLSKQPAAQPPRRRRHTVAVEAAGGGL